MPHLPDHITHDPELIAAYAAGDATGSDLALATELVADCTDCAALHRDLRSIATALPELPAPVRARDFRLTPEQAASLAPSGWRGVLAAFASPRFRLAAPMGTGLAAIGLAGLLLGTPGAVLPRVETSGTGAAAGAPATAPAEASGAPLIDAAAPDVVRAQTDADGGSAAEDAAGLTGPAAGSAASSAPVAAFEPPPTEVPGTTNDRELALAAGTPAATSAGDAAAGQEPMASDGGTFPWLPVSAALFLVGVALVVLRLAARSIGRS